MPSNLKMAITGTYHAFKFEKYAERYLTEFQYCFNRRFDLKALHPWPQAELTDILNHLPAVAAPDPAINRALWTRWQTGLQKPI